MVTASVEGAPLALAMGDAEGAHAWVARFRRVWAANAPYLEGQLAFEVGDFSRAAKAWAAFGDTDAAFAIYGRQRAHEVRWLLGLTTDAPLVNWSRGAMRKPPSAARWHAANINPLVSRWNDDENRVAAKLLLNERRQKEMLDYYYRDTGLLGLGPKQRPSNSVLVAAAPAVALVLRLNGREAEAERLLAAADRQLRASFRQGRVPFWFYAKAAEVWAVQGKHDQALKALEVANSRGWVHVGKTDLFDIADEPAFASLRTQPRFQRIRQRIEAHIKKERLELRSSI